MLSRRLSENSLWRNRGNVLVSMTSMFSSKAPVRKDTGKCSQDRMLLGAAAAELSGPGVADGHDESRGGGGLFTGDGDDWKREVWKGGVEGV